MFSKTMKYIVISIAIALSALLSGCANLPAMLSGQQPDPVVVRAKTTANRAEISVAEFLALQKSKPEDESDVEALNLSRSLEQHFPKQLAAMLAMLEAYEQTKSPPVKTALLPLIDTVKAAGDTAQANIGSPPPVPNRYDNGFAPPITPQVDMNSLWVNIAEMRSMLSSNASQMEGLNLKVKEMDGKLTRLTVVQRRALSTNATASVPPSTNVIPSRVP